MKHPLVVCHIITTLGGGGAERQLAELVAASPPDLLRHHVIGLSDSFPPQNQLEQAAASLLCLGMRAKPLKALSGFSRLIMALRRIKPDIVQTWLYHADLLGALAAPLAGARPLIWYLQASDLDMSLYDRITALVRQACCWLSRRPDVITANSHAGLAAHQSLGYANAHTSVIPNGFDTEFFQPNPQARTKMRARLGLSPDHLLVGMVARLDPVKDHLGFLQAAAEVAAGNPQARFLLLGRGVDADPRLRALAGAAELAGRCHLLGHSEEVYRWLPAMDLHVSSSMSEGTPNAVGEAMATGVPNVVTQVGDSPLLVGDTGRVVQPKDPAALAAAMLALLALPREQRLELGRAARQRIIANYSLANLVNSFSHLYQSLLNGHPPATPPRP